MAAPYPEVNNGDRILYTNTGSAIAVGDVVPVATGATGFCGVAVVAIAASTGTGVLDVKPGKRFTLLKASGEAFTQGQILYWNTSTGLTGTNTTTNTKIGRAALAAASADVTADCLLHGTSAA